MEKEALHYEIDETGRLHCRLCPHECRIAENRTGLCHVRRRQGNRLLSLNYSRIAALSVDPVEKKPLYHFLPGSATLSFACMGCNFHCRFCQNHTISKVSENETDFGEPMSPEDIVSLAVSRNVPSISFTYTEPTVFYEMMLETARFAKAAGLKTILVSNGYINPAPLDELIPYLDAANIDLKAWSDRFYQNLCGGHLEPVLSTLRRLRQAGVWLEITTLLIPGHNDNPREIDPLIEFIAGLGTDIPWHLSRFSPQYLLTDAPPTPPEQVVETLERAQKKGLLHLYAGNLQHNEFTDTLCPECRSVLIRRKGYQIQLERLDTEGRCRTCHHPLAGVFVQPGR